MADLNQEGVFVQVRVSVGDFNDAIYYSAADFAKLRDEDLQAAKDERYNAWLAFVQEQSNKPVTEPTDAELIEMKEKLEEQKASIARDISEIDEKLSK